MSSKQVERLKAAEDKLSRRRAKAESMGFYQEANELAEAEHALAAAVDALEEREGLHLAACNDCDWKGEGTSLVIDTDDPVDSGFRVCPRCGGKNTYWFDDPALHKQLDDCQKETARLRKAGLALRKNGVLTHYLGDDDQQVAAKVMMGKALDHDAT